MASLPSAVAVNTLKLEPEFKKHPTTFLPVEKRNYNTTHLDKLLDPICLDFREAVSMMTEGKTIESSMYVPLLQGCIEKNSALQAQCIHGHILKTGTYEDVFVMTSLVNVYAKCGVMEDARKIFDNLPQRNVVTWTSLMSGYVYNSQPETATRVFLEMLEVGAYPTNYTLGIVLNACSSLSHFDVGKQIHGYAVKYGIDCDTSVGNALCSLYSRLGCLDSVIEASRKISEKNVISWTTVISACGDNGDSERGLSLFIEMLSDGVEPNEFTLTCILSLCCVMQALDVGSQIHSLSIKLGYESNLPVTNSVMFFYLKCGWISGAKKLFDGMGTKSLVAWNAIIAGHAQMVDLAEDGVSAHRRGIEALNMFLRLKRSDLKPDLYTFSSILTVCSSLVALDQGAQIHAQTIKTGLLSDVVVGTALVNMYHKCGSIERAIKAFLEMSTRTLISWTAMITAFAQHGRSQQALQLFEDMRLAGVRPNAVTFVAVLSACSHSGMIDQALAYFEMMQNDYRIKPVMDHFACMIDMFVRIGRLEEAFEFVKKMDIEPSEFIWSNLVAGCRSQGNLELAFYAAEKLLCLSPRDAETYVFLLNMYISAGRWKDVSRVRKMMKNEKLVKLKDRSWISIREKVHTFKPGWRSCLPSREVENLLADLLEKARTFGYEPQRSLDVTEEHGETTLFTAHHSEKLAVAFGLLNVPNATPIRVIKSVSMCGDCHSFIKYVSLLSGRKIIIRDSKRLHKFVNGHCSCGDFSSPL